MTTTPTSPAASQQAAVDAALLILERMGLSPDDLTVAGIVGYAARSSRIRGSNASTDEPAGLRSYFGGPSLASAGRTVFLETPSARAIALIGIPSALCSLRISAPSSTVSTSLPRHTPPSQKIPQRGCSAGVDVRASPMPGCPAVAPGGRGSAALVFPFLIIVAVGTGRTDGSVCRRVTAAAISPAQAIVRPAVAAGPQ
jgi:hypothetical protein